LAESADVDRSLGSRHRAAIGMSQEADAVVIVVSEETGTISVAIHGRLRRGFSPQTLRETLTKELGGTSITSKTRSSNSKAQSPTHEVA
jgi:diadenylate cyclase